jgi:hypothetical protein
MVIKIYEDAKFKSQADNDPRTTGLKHWLRILCSRNCNVSLCLCDTNERHTLWILYVYKKLLKILLKFMNLFRAGICANKISVRMFPWRRITAVVDGGRWYFIHWFFETPNKSMFQARYPVRRIGRVKMKLRDLIPPLYKWISKVILVF